LRYQAYQLEQEAAMQIMDDEVLYATQASPGIEYNPLSLSVAEEKKPFGK
jgi:hypothetical protein